MDFVIKLLKSKDSTTETLDDLIIIVVDKLTKYINFILFKKILMQNNQDIF